MSQGWYKYKSLINFKIFKLKGDLVRVENIYFFENIFNKHGFADTAVVNFEISFNW